MIAREQLEEEIMMLIGNITDEANAMRDDVSVDLNDVKVSFIEGVEVDSLMALEIIAALEKKYDIEIPEEEFPNMATFEDTVGLVFRLLEEKEKVAD